jgi:hypothetical protein
MSGLQQCDQVFGHTHLTHGAALVALRGHLHMIVHPTFGYTLLPVLRASVRGYQESIQLSGAYATRQTS